MPPKKATVFPCLGCKKPVTKKTGGVKCNYCEEWVHAKCGGITPAHLLSLEECEGSSWTCKPCRGVSQKFKQELQLLNLKQTRLKAQVDENQEAISKQDTRLTRVEQELKNVETDKIVEKSEEAIYEEFRERENRRDNLVIHQVTEAPNNIEKGGERKDYDIKKVIEIFKFLKCPMNQEGIKFIYRPGELTGADRPRPIILSLYDRGAREYILSNTRMLANSVFKHISIIPDLTPKQRKEEDRLRKTAEMRNKEMDKDEAENWEWVLVGMRGQRKLIKKKIIHPGGNLGAHRGGDKAPNLLTGANATAVYQTARIVENLSSQQTAARGMGRGRGGRVSRGGSGATRSASRNPEPEPSYQEPILLTPPSPNVMRPETTLEDLEDVQEEMIMEPEPSLKPRDVLPSTDEEGEEEENMNTGELEGEEGIGGGETMLETGMLEGGEMMMGEKEKIKPNRDKKRPRADQSTSPPQTNLKKKPTK